MTRTPGNGATDTAPEARFADGTPDCGHVNIRNSRYVCRRGKGHPGLHCDARIGPGAFWLNADVVEPLPEER